MSDQPEQPAKPSQSYLDEKRFRELLNEIIHEWQFIRGYDAIDATGIVGTTPDGIKMVWIYLSVVNNKRKTDQREDRYENLAKGDEETVRKNLDRFVGGYIKAFSKRTGATWLD